MQARPSLKARQVAFSRFVRRALDDALMHRGWNQVTVLEKTGTKKSTLHRWLRGDWTEDPKAGQVLDFCDGLDIPPAAAFLILWPGKRDRSPMPGPPPMDPDVELVLRRLVDPKVTEQEKYHIRETLRALARRPGPPSQRAS
ncbi:transcriptional regulator [Phytohabitans aurantiacus]|nr:transcriptional regulator [Phytohabitans aurantiacus]